MLTRTRARPDHTAPNLTHEAAATCLAAVTSSEGKFRCLLFSWVRGIGVPRNFFRGGGSTNSVVVKENGDRGAVAPYSGVLEAVVIWYKKFHLI